MYTHNVNNFLVGDFSREVGGQLSKLCAVEQAQTLLQISLHARHNESVCMYVRIETVQLVHKAWACAMHMSSETETDPYVHKACVCAMYMSVKTETDLYVHKAWVCTMYVCWNWNRPACTQSMDLYNVYACWNWKWSDCTWGTMSQYACMLELKQISLYTRQNVSVCLYVRIETVQLVHKAWACAMHMSGETETDLYVHKAWVCTMYICWNWKWSDCTWGTMSQYACMLEE